jgi:hypothetical protein
MHLLYTWHDLVARRLKEQFGYEVVAMVGGGVTDLEARASCETFIGFGGNVARDNVQIGADWDVTDFSQMTDALALRTGGSCARSRVMSSC